MEHLNSSDSRGPVVVEEAPSAEDGYYPGYHLPRGGRRYSDRVGELGEIVKIGGERWQVVNSKGTIVVPFSPSSDHS